MSLFVSIAIVSPVTLFLCVLIIRKAEKVFNVWPDITKEERWVVWAKRAVVIVATLVLLSAAVELGTYGAIALHSL